MVVSKIVKISRQVEFSPENQNFVLWLVSGVYRCRTGSEILPNVVTLSVRSNCFIDKVALVKFLKI